MPGEESASLWLQFNQFCVEFSTMIISRGYKFRLYPTDQQEILFAQFAGTCRFVYNLALEQRKDWWRKYLTNTGKHISYASQNLELTALRADVDWIEATPCDALQYALRDLNQAFQKFFSGKANYPTPRKRGENDSFRIPFSRSHWRKLNAKWGVVHIPKIGKVKFRLTRDIPATINNINVSHDDLGWHVAFSTEVEVEVTPSLKPAVGIDRGVVHTLALSDVTFRDIDRERLRLLDRRARKHQRALARKKRGSNRRAQARRALARTKAVAARLRRHWNHQRSHEIAESFGLVVLEDLPTSNMTRSAKGTVDAPGRNVRQKAGLNREILNNGWTQFAEFVTYKVAAAGGVTRKVNPAYTSQTCSECHVVDAESRENQATFRCSNCGFSCHADTNAALNILRAGTQPAPLRPKGKRSKKRELKGSA